MRSVFSGLYLVSRSGDEGWT